MVAIRQGITLEEFLKLPEKKPALEFEDGVVIRKVSPKPKHARLQPTMAALFDRFGEPQKLFLAFTEARTTFGGHSYVPDIVVYRWDRIPRDSMGRVGDDFWDPPDVVVEIVSPSQSVNAMVRRCIWYVEIGVKAALMVDAKDDSIIVFKPGEKPRALRAPERLDLASALPGFQVPVAQIFDALTLS